MSFSNKEIRTRLFDAIDLDAEQITKDLCDFLAIPSVSDDRENVGKALEHILLRGTELGFQTYSLAGDQVGRIDMGDGPETLGILTHVDVVPAEPLEDWASDPFLPEIRDGKIYGRGALDDKGMVIASLYAMKAVRDLGLPIKKKVELIMGTREEISWEDMDKYISDYPLPNYGFTPDGEFPVQNVEKGVCDLVMEFPVPAANVENAASPYVVSINSGTASNCVPGRAEALLSNGERIVAAGCTVHSSNPGKGVNAIFELRKALQKRIVQRNIFTDILDMLYEETFDFVGKKMPFYKEEEYYQGEFVHRNVFVPTLFATENGKISVLIDIRFVIGTEIEGLVDYFTAKAEKLGGSLWCKDLMPAVFVPREKPFLQAFAKAYENVTEEKGGFATGFGASYAKTMPNIVGWGPVFPGDVDTCHEANEFISVENLMRCTKIYACAIAEIVLQDKSFL